MAIRGVIPRLTLDALGGPGKVLSGLHIAGGATPASGAAWLVFKHRKAFHRAGVVDFCFDERQAMPKWFPISLEVFRQRSRSWNVVVLTNPGRSVTYRVVWLDWRAQRSRGKS